MDREVMSRKKSLDESTAADMKPASNSNKISSSNKKKERTAAGSLSADPISISPPLSTQILKGITMVGKKLQYVVLLLRPRCGIKKMKRKTNSFSVYGPTHTSTCLELDDSMFIKGRRSDFPRPPIPISAAGDGLVNEGIYWSVKSTLATAKTTKTNNESSTKKSS